MEYLYKDALSRAGNVHAITDLWDDLRGSITENARKYLIKDAEHYLGYSFAPIPATLFMDFKRTGNRVRFEDVYFNKRRVLNSLVLGELCEDKGRFVDDIINGIYSICEESAWQLPAHNSYKRDTPQNILPNTDRPIIELFACETGAQLATISYVLKDKLDSVSDEICHRINSEPTKRIIKPYLNEHFWWMGREDEPMCNWTIWCTQNILLTAAQMDDPTIPLEDILSKAAGSVDYFLKDYGDDGCCDEGAMYYHHAGLCMYITTYLLDLMTDGAFKGCMKNAKIKNIAEYISNVHIYGSFYLNYADCAPILEPAGAREYLLGKMVDSPSLMSYAALDFKASLESNEVSSTGSFASVKASSAHYLKDEINLSYRLLTIMYEKEILNYAKENPDQIPAGNVYYESAGVFVTRHGDIVLSVKAGDNDDSHNHNDTGSIILYAKNKPALIDVGVESYTAKTFSERRYEIWTMQSGYHNLPTIAGYDQLPGADYHASSVQVSDDLTSIELDIRDAYPQECKLRSYKRYASLIPSQSASYQDSEPDSGLGDVVDKSLDSASIPEGKLIIKDSWEFEDDADNKDIILNFMTYEKPEVMLSEDPSTDGIFKIGDLCTFKVTGAGRYEIEAIPVTDPRLQKTWKHEIYRVRFYPCENSNEFTLRTI